MLFRYLILFSFVINLFFISAQQNKYQNLLQHFLNDPNLSSAHIGVHLLDSDGISELLEYQADKLFVPASITKIWTTAMATRILKPQYMFKTIVAHDGDFDALNQTLIGNLYVITNGDPSLESRFIEKSFLNDFRQKLTQLNIKNITGRLIILPDQDQYDVCSHWLWSDLGNYYGAGYSSSTFMDNMVELYFNTKNPLGDTCEISKTVPYSTHFLLNNEVTVGNLNKDLSYAFGAPLQQNRTIKGKLPKRDSSYKVKVSMHHPKDFLYESTHEVLKQLNIMIMNYPYPVSSPTDTLLNYNSPQLSEIIKIINFESNNNYAEHLLVECSKGKEAHHCIDTAANFMVDFWSNKFSKNVFFSDGSGLSRKNLITPRSMNGLLGDIMTNFNPDEKQCMMNSFPIAGITGTLRYIGKKTPIEGNFIGKSGSMGGVRCYTGFFTKNNSHFPFTIMVNHFSAPDYKIRKAIESLMVNIYKEL